MVRYGSGPRWFESPSTGYGADAGDDNDAGNLVVGDVAIARSSTVLMLLMLVDGCGSPACVQDIASLQAVVARVLNVPFNRSVLSLYSRLYALSRVDHVCQNP